MKEIDLYLRKSKIVREEDARDLTSVVTQEEIGRRWADRHGYTVRHVWVDNLSAWSDVNRPQFDKALDAVLAGEVAALWCAFLDRFTRKGVEGIIPILGKARVIFDYEGLDSFNERDRRWIIDRAEQAREYSQRLSYNIRTTKDSQRARGKWLGAPPFGFAIDGMRSRKLVRNDAWPVVERIFREVAAGKSTRAVSLGLNSDEVASPDGATWRATAVARIVRSPVYEGWQVVVGPQARRPEVFRDGSGNRVSVLAEGTSPVDPALVAKARLALSGFVARPAGPMNPLRGLVRCAGCGDGMPRNGRTYVCARYRKGQPCPSPGVVLATALERHVRDRWIARLSAADPEDPLLAEVAERYAALTRPTEAAGAQDALAALKVAEAGVQRLATQQAAGLFDPPFDTHLPALQAEARAALLAAQEAVAALNPTGVDISFLLDHESAAHAFDSADLLTRHGLLAVAIRRIYVAKAPEGYKGPLDGIRRVRIEWHGVSGESV